VLRHPFTLTVLSTALLACSTPPSISPAMAQAPMVKTSAPAYYRIMVGNFEVTALSDGTNALPVDQLLTHTTPEKVDATLAANFLKSPVETSVNAFLVNTGTRLILIDTGAGSFFGPTVGKLQQNLKAAGYRADQINDVFITHMHPDHVGGLLNGKEAAFPNAVVHINKVDTDFWLSKANLDAAPDSAKIFFQDAAAALAPYIRSKKLVTFEGSVELIPGVRSMPLAGHTGGHTGYMVESNGQSILMWGDIVHVRSIQFADPSVTIAYDSDPDKAAPTRIAEFTDAAQKGYLVASAHLPFPGIGHVVAKGSTFEWLPVEYSVVH
jgi:glyoxylase-like metal-dependent hydrolase (beta-lactamase superfamily II)